MSSSGICLDDTIRISGFATSLRRLCLVSGALCSLVAAGVLAVDRTPRQQSAPSAPSAATSGGILPALRVARHLDGRPATAMRYGLATDPRALGSWIPDATTAPPLCALPPRDTLWSALAMDDLGARPGPSRARRFNVAVGVRWRGHLAPRLASSRKAGPSDALQRLNALLPLDFAGLGKADVDPLKGAMVHGLGAPVDDVQSRHAAALGFAADSLRFDDHPGRLSAAAQAGLWNGAPATAIGVGYTLPDGRVRLDATGVTYVNSLATMGKTFQMSTVASIPLE